MKTYNWISKITWNATFFNYHARKWKGALDKGGNISVLFMDLSKAFDKINHDLLLVKLKSYQFSISVLDLMCSYLKKRKQPVQINNSFSSAKMLHSGLPQGSINGPLLFDLFINDSVLFLSETLLSNYADDNNLYSLGKDLDVIKNMIIKDFRALTEWFSKNFLILNQKNVITCALVEIMKIT